MTSVSDDEEHGVPSREANKTTSSHDGMNTGTPVEKGGKSVSSQATGETHNESEDDDISFHDAEDASSSIQDRTPQPKLGLQSGPPYIQDLPEYSGTEESAESPGGERSLNQRPFSESYNPSAISPSNECPITGQADTKGDFSTVDNAQDPVEGQRTSLSERNAANFPAIKRQRDSNVPTVSQWSHQRLASQHSLDDDEEEEEEEEEEEAWQAMPALGQYDIFDDEGRLVARGTKEDTDEPYAGIGGAGKGYTRVQIDEDAQSATSMDDHTRYLFKEGSARNNLEDDDEEQRDAVAQLQATKDLLTEGQRIAYVGVTRLTIYNMVKELQTMEKTKTTKKEILQARESMEKWGQQMMVRLYGHMDIDAAEQVMIEQLAEHGVQPADLVPPLMRNSRVSNPMADQELQNGRPSSDSSTKQNGLILDHSSKPEDLPLQEVNEAEEVPDVQSPADIARDEKIDLDLRWTVLCDLFLVLISDSVYDARSRFLLERVGSTMDISWVQICRFEKRVIDALEMQEEASKENWNEAENLENRRKKALKRKYVVMGLATVGGGLVIGLSAGLLAPVIGAGLAAGFTTIGVTGTAGFLGGAGGAALITSAATAAGGTIAVRASNKRTGHVKTFEYRPLHNNKRLNLIVTVSGWMNGKVDDVRLPYSTVDPIMGDIYSVLWEPEMLRSMGDTINILATEALTQTVQQVLGSTLLVALMASLQLPIVLSKLSYLIDNPWTVSLDRANAAGLILADSLIDRHLGQRPVTLLGFSLGSRLIFSCLKELANRGAYGIVQNVYLFGSPLVAKKDEFTRVRSIVSGRFVNGYASNDWILAYLFRLTSGGIMRVAGLAPIEDIPGLENLDVTHLVSGHMAYRAAMPRILREVGWEVESDEFTEIEDPDPDNHTKRQRELIQEIDEARKKAEETPQKRRFGIFKRGKLAEKRGWEMYDLEKQRNMQSNLNSQAAPGLESNVLFDIEAIRKELESEMIEVRELDSTLPPMQISTLANGEKKTEPMPQPPPGVKPEELAQMKLPPRPCEIDNHPPLLPTADKNKGTPISRNRTPTPEYDLAAPRELKTTLPPLTLSPSPPQDEFHFQPLSGSLPGKRGPPSPPPPADWGAEWCSTGPTAGTDLASPIATLSLERNAWVDDADEFGHEREVRMTFEEDSFK